MPSSSERRSSGLPSTSSPWNRVKAKSGAEAPTSRVSAVGDGPGIGVGTEVGVAVGSGNGVATGLAAGALPQPAQVAAERRTEKQAMEMNALLPGRKAESAECLNLIMPSASSWDFHGTFEMRNFNARFPGIGYCTVWFDCSANQRRFWSRVLLLGGWVDRGLFRQLAGGGCMICCGEFTPTLTLPLRGRGLKGLVTLPLDDFAGARAVVAVRKGMTGGEGRARDSSTRRRNSVRSCRCCPRSCRGRCTRRVRREPGTGRG